MLKKTVILRNNAQVVLPAMFTLGENTRRNVVGCPTDSTDLEDIDL